MEKGKSEVLRGHDALIARLRAGETIVHREKGNSMVPKIYSREPVELVPVNGPDEIEKGHVVWCKVGRNFYTHLVSAKRLEGTEWRFQISNNKGHVNGWIGIESIFGRAVSAGGRPLKS